MKWRIRYGLFLSVLCLQLFAAFSVVSTSNAQQFYPDSKSFYWDSSTTLRTFTILPTSTRTILGVSMMTDTSNHTEILCGQDEIFDNWGNNSVSFAAVQFVCNNAIKFTKAANGSLAIIVTYSDGLISSTTSTTNTAGYTGPNMQEWLFVSCVFLFFLSLLTWRLVLSPFMVRIK